MRQLIFAFPLLMTFPSLAQHSETLNSDIWKYRFGFLLAENWTEKWSTTPGTGFSLGLTMEYRLTKKIFLSPQPMLSYLTYKYGHETVEATNIEIPFHILLKPFDSKFKPTISFGPKYRMSLTSSLYGQWFVDIALGLERQLKYFTIAPEVRYSYRPSMQAIYFAIHFKG
jgi:hypothetical protein